MPPRKKTSSKTAAGAGAATTATVADAIAMKVMMENNASLSSAAAASTHRSPKKHPAQEQQNEGMSLADLQAMYEDLTVEADSRIRAMRSKQADHLAKLERTSQAMVLSLDDRIRHITLGDFIDLYGADEEIALGAMVEMALTIHPMVEGERSVRTRKRAAPTSPSQERERREDAATTQGGNLESEDVFAIGSKRAKGPIEGIIASTSKTGTSRSGRSTKDATATRSTRARPKAGTSSSATTASGIASTSNFVYRSCPSNVPGLNNPRLPPTPSIGTNHRATMNGTAARRPRRGESIIMLSVNDSPLGLGFAGEDDEEEDEVDRALLGKKAAGDEDDDDEDSQDHWDMMDHSKASRSEEHGEAKGSTKGNDKKGKGRLVQQPLLGSSSHPSTAANRAPTRQSSRTLASPRKPIAAASSFASQSTEFTFVVPTSFNQSLQRLAEQVQNTSGTMTDDERLNAHAQLASLMADLI